MTRTRRLQTCSICSNTGYTGFFKFPSTKMAENRQKWLDAFGLKVATESMKVCKRHFAAGEFTTRNNNSPRLRLFMNAVPTLHLKGIYSPLSEVSRVIL